VAVGRPAAARKDRRAADHLVAAGAALGGVADVPGLAVYNTQSVYFSPLEWLALIAAIGISIWCMASRLAERSTS